MSTSFCVATLIISGVCPSCSRASDRFKDIILLHGVVTISSWFLALLIAYDKIENLSIEGRLSLMLFFENNGQKMTGLVLIENAPARTVVILLLMYGIPLPYVFPNVLLFFAEFIHPSIMSKIGMLP